MFDSCEEIGLYHALLHKLCVLNTSVKLVGPEVFDKQSQRYQSFEINLDI